MSEPKEFFLKCPNPSCKGHAFRASELWFDQERVRCPDCTHEQSFRGVLDRYRKALGIAVDALEEVELANETERVIESEPGSTHVAEIVKAALKRLREDA